MNKHSFRSVDKYPIDEISLKPSNCTSINIDSYTDMINTSILDDLKLGLMLYNKNLDDVHRSLVPEEAFKQAVSFIANTGYGLNVYSPPKVVKDLIENQPDLAITDLEKALLGHIINYYSLYVSFYDEEERAQYENILFSYISMFNEARNYEYANRITVDFSRSISDSILLGILTNSESPSDSEGLAGISDADYKRLAEVLEYRELMKNTITEWRKAEKEYICKDENVKIWELFISYLNFAQLNEERVVNIIQADINPRDKIHEFEDFINSTPDLNAKLLNSEFTLFELLTRIDQRREWAPNYMWISDDKNSVFVDDNLLSFVVAPYTFNYVLIAYHAFLLNPAKENVVALTFSLNMYLRKNLSQIVDDSYNELDSLEDCIIVMRNLIVEFYEKHRQTIDVLKYDSILAEDTLSGFGLHEDIMRLVAEHEMSWIVEASRGFAQLSGDKQQRLMSKILECSQNGCCSEDVLLMKENIQSYLGINSIDEQNAFECELGKRLIISINAVYILVMTIDRLLKLPDMIRIEKKSEIENVRDELGRLEKYLIQTTYIAPNYKCFSNVDVEKYRLEHGIDVSCIEKKNDELNQRALLAIAEGKFLALHNQINELSLETAVRIKDDFRKELKEYPNCELKEYLIKMMDYESKCICDALIKQNSSSISFNEIKGELLNKLNSNSYILPNEAIDSLVTAELLFSQYAEQSFAEERFDYSCISSLYYQAVESIYNTLIWKPYSEMLNSMKYGNDRYPYLYVKKKGNLPKDLDGYLPQEKTYKYMDNNRKYYITPHLTMGTFNYLINNLCASKEKSLPHLLEHFECVFGYDDVSRDSDDYKRFGHVLDNLSRSFGEAVPLRNDASHGEKPISLTNCLYDKKLVLSDLSITRECTKGIINTFLSLYKT